MDFFEYQDQARKNTRLLLVFFVAAVLSLIVLTNLLILFVANYQNTYNVSTGTFYYSWPMFFGVSAFVVSMIAGGSFYRIASLSKGGSVVAEMLDGELLVSGNGDLKRQRLLNVVEEMAIASGTPVPPVYLIADPAINAFAAGYSTGDAVIGVTEGAIENLNREQLQGVIAHEFSHVLNGDMRLNIRLMGVLYGILMLAIIGRIILRPGRTVRTSNRKGSGGAIIAIGLGLLILGYVGKFFGGLIKAAVSRQREFLADASAVQFTRNPEGIGGALKRIGGYAQGSVVDKDASEEVSHAFFAQGIRTGLTSMMATHPPLAERIKRIDPRWDGDFLTDTVGESEVASGAARLVSGFAGQQVNAQAAIAGVGHPGETQLAVARGILKAMPDALANAAREPYSARAVVYLILLDSDVLVRARQLELLESQADAFVFERFSALVPLSDELLPEMRLPLLEMALPSLRQLSRPQYDRFRENLAALVRADHKISLSEWAVQRFVTHHLEEAFERKRSHPRYKRFNQVRHECAVLLSMLAYSDSGQDNDPAHAFESGRSVLGIDIAIEDKKDLALTAINAALDKLIDLRPLMKPKLLKACVATITADGMVSPVEAELVRAIADSLDCPMPPFDRLES